MASWPRTYARYAGQWVQMSLAMRLNSQHNLKRHLHDSGAINSRGGSLTFTTPLIGQHRLAIASARTDPTSIRTGPVG